MATIRPTGYLAHYGFSDEDVLEHYGVRGMKWGKRKALKIAIRGYDSHIRNLEKQMQHAKNEIQAAKDERRTGMTVKPIKRVAPNTGYEYYDGYDYAEKDAYDRQKDAQRLQMAVNNWHALNAKHRSTAAKRQKEAEEYDDSRLDKVIARGAKSAAEKGKKKIKDLLNKAKKK